MGNMTRASPAGNDMTSRLNTGLNQGSANIFIRYPQNSPNRSRQHSYSSSRASGKDSTVSSDIVSMSYTPSRPNHINGNNNRRYSQSTPIKNRQFSYSSSRTSSGETSGTNDAGNQANAASLPVKYFQCHRPQYK